VPVKQKYDVFEKYAGKLLMSLN